MFASNQHLHNTLQKSFARCKKIFDSDIKQTPVSMKDPKTIVAQTKQLAALNAMMQTEKQKKDLEMVQKRHQMAAEMMK